MIVCTLSNFEKVDVCSFGVANLEILCGRKVFDNSQDEEDRNLLCLLNGEAEDHGFLRHGR